MKADRELWLQRRISGIGGSDAASVIGLNPYKSNVALWEEKTGIRIPEDISDKPYVQYGNNAEDYLRELFQLDFPQYQVDYDQFGMIANLKDHPYIFATLDGHLIDEKGRHGILEIKTTEIMNGTQISKWKDGIPDNYYVQVLHQFLATGYDFAIVKAQIKFAFDGVRLETRHYKMERAEVLEDIHYLFQKEVLFWKRILEKRKPDLILPDI